MEVHFDNRAGSAELVLGSTSYTNAAGQAFTVSKFDYYVSNFKFKKTDGSYYVVPQASSYFLIKENAPTSQELSFASIPEGDYTEVTFTVGVDSARNCMDISQRTGVLDPAAGGAGMYWSWNSGYIFLKMEGTSPEAPLDSVSNTRPFMFHVGGFGGYSSQTINNLRTVTIPFNKTIAIRQDGDKPSAHVFVDAIKVMNGSTNISLASNSTVMFSTFSLNLSANYANMFALDHIH